MVKFLYTCKHGYTILEDRGDRTTEKVNNPYASGRCGSHFKSVMLEHMLMIKFMSPSCERAIKWIAVWSMNLCQEHWPPIHTWSEVIPAVSTELRNKTVLKPIISFHRHCGYHRFPPALVYMIVAVSVKNWRKWIILSHDSNKNWWYKHKWNGVPIVCAFLYWLLMHGDGGVLMCSNKN